MLLLQHGVRGGRADANANATCKCYICIGNANKVSIFCGNYRIAIVIPFGTTLSNSSIRKPQYISHYEDDREPITDSYNQHVKRAFVCAINCTDKKFSPIQSTFKGTVHNYPSIFPPNAGSK